MFVHTYRTTTQEVDIASLWRVWSDVNHWAEWQSDVALAQLETEFITGGRFVFQPKGGPKLKLWLSYVSEGRQFTDLTRFVGAQLLGTHEFIQRDNEVEIVIGLSLSGMLTKLWKKWVVDDIVKSLPMQTEALIARAVALNATSVT